MVTVAVTPRETSDYLMEDPREAERLTDKVDAPAWVARYLSRYLAEGSRVLDVGAGPGVIAEAVAAHCPRGHVVALDQSAARSEAARARLEPRGGHAIRGDARQLPFPDGTFDLVYCRLLLEYLEDPAAAVREMIRVCRPGGRVLLQDLDGQLLWHYPEDPELQLLLQATLAALAQRGFDPFAGRKLFHHCYNAGLRDLETQVDVYHHYAGAIDRENARLWALKLDIALPAITRALGNEAAAHNLKARFLEHLARPDTFTYSNVITVTGTV